MLNQFEKPENESSLEERNNLGKNKKRIIFTVLFSCVVLFVVAVFVGFKIKNYFTEPRLGVSSRKEEMKIPLVGSNIQNVPLFSGTNSTSVIDFDSIVDEKNNIHITYQTNEGNFYIQGRPKENLWNKPVKLSLSGLSKIVWTPGGLHVLLRSGEKIFHLLSSDNGETWSELPPIINADRFICNYDVAAVGNDIVVAYTTAEQGVGVTDIDVKVSRWSSDQSSNSELLLPVIIASFQSIYTLSPVELVADGDTLHLVYGINSQTSGNISSHIYYTKSDDIGSAWLIPVEVSLSGGESSRGTIDGDIQLLGEDSLNLFIASDKFYLFYRDSILFLTESDNGFNWSPAIALSPYGSTQADKRTIAVASSANSTTRIVWIDGRFELMTPQFGIPWSDANPYWGNNDIFTATISDSNGQLQMLGSGNLEGGLSVYRLTESVSFSRSVAVYPIENGFLVIWSGVKGAESDESSRMKDYKSRLFYTILPS